MKKIGNCDQCHKRKELNNKLESNFHMYFKYKDLPIIVEGHFLKAKCSPRQGLFLCKSCMLDVMRAMKNGDNWE